MNEKKRFFYTLTSVIIILLLIGLLIFFNDPYENFDGRIISGLDRRKYHKILGKELKYNTAILGSSLSEKNLCSIVDKVYNVESMNFSLSYTSTEEIAFLWQYFSQYNKFKMVMIDLRIIREITVDDIKLNIDYYNDNHNLLYKNIVNLNLSSLKNILKFFLLDDNKKFIHKDNYTPLHNNTKEQRLNRMAKRYTHCVIEAIDLDESKNIFDENLREYLEPCFLIDKDTKVILFLPPFSILAYNDNMIDNYTEITQYILESLLKYDNVYIYDFQTIPEIFDFSNYTDAVHYSRDINTWMIQAMKDDNYLVTKENLDARCEKLRTMVKEYDYEKAYSELDAINEKNQQGE